MGGSKLRFQRRDWFVGDLIVRSEIECSRAEYSSIYSRPVAFLKGGSFKYISTSQYLVNTSMPRTAEWHRFL
jgi:hypothetical protein